MHLVGAGKREEGLLEIITRWLVQQQSTIQCSSCLDIRNRYLHTEDSIDLDFVWILKILGARQMPEQHCQIDFEYKM